MNEPRIHLMEKDLVAHEKNAGKHVLNHWVAAHAPLVKRIQKFTTSKTMFLNIRIQLRQGREKLLVEGEAELERGDGERPVLQVLTLDG